MINYYSELEQKIEKYVRKYGNRPKKTAIRLAYWNFLQLFKNLNREDFCKKNKNSKNLNVAIILSGGVGDFVVNAKYLIALNKILENYADIYIYSSLNLDVAKGILNNLDFKFKLFTEKEYEEKNSVDIVIKQSRIPFLMKYDKKRFEEQLSKKSVEYFNKLEYFNKKYGDFSGGTIKDFVGVKFSKICKRNRHNEADIYNLLGLEKIEYSLNCDDKFLNILNEYLLEKDKYITIQRNIQSASEATRLWSISNYEKLISLIKTKYPQYKIIQLGRKDTYELKGIDIDLLGKTNFEELKIVLQNAKLHIDCDCGMVHLRHALGGGKSVVLFGPTDADFIGYPENINIHGESCGGKCEWRIPEWNTKYLYSNSAQAKCMELITPEYVSERIEGEI